MLLRLRVRAARWPGNGVARLKADYHRKTLAALRGAERASRRPVIVAEGFDPQNILDWNDLSAVGDTRLTHLVNAARQQHGLDVFLLDWGDGGSLLEQQAEDFAEIARQIQGWNADRRETIVIGISMGAVSLRYALAAAADEGTDLGVRRYISINGPHRGAWVSSELVKLLKKVGPESEQQAASQDPFRLRSPLSSPAAQELLMNGPLHEAFYAKLRGKGKDGYHPEIPRVAFSNGSFVTADGELAAAKGKPVIYRVSVRPLWLPFRVTVHRTRREFQYGGYPGELMPFALRNPIRDHGYLLGIFRYDLRAGWETIPTFIPTHSALDFPSELEGKEDVYQYTDWQQSAFSTVYVSASGNLAHDDTSVQWINPRNGQVPPGENAVLYEVLKSFPTELTGD